MLKKFFSLIIFSLFLFVCDSYAFKIVQLDQPKVRLSIPPGGSKSGRIEIKNPSAEPKEVKVTIEDWVYENIYDGSKTFFQPGTAPRNCSPWINFAPAEFTVPPFGKEYVNYVVKVPAEAKGGYYSGLFFESMMSPSEEKSDATVVVPVAVSVGSLFYVEVKDTIVRKAELENLSMKKTEDTKVLDISLDFKNAGNVDITASGNYNIIDSRGVIYARGLFSNVYTLPGDIAKLQATWKEPIPKGEYDFVITLDLGKALEELGMGRGPVIVKEAAIEVGEQGEVLRIGELK
jgi:hypothetical protein